MATHGIEREPVSGTPDYHGDADELARVRQDIEGRRRELGTTIEELAERANIGARARRAAERARARAVSGTAVAAVAGGLLLAAVVAAAVRARRRRHATGGRIEGAADPERSTP